MTRARVSSPSPPLHPLLSLFPPSGLRASLYLLDVLCSLGVFFLSLPFRPFLILSFFWRLIFHPSPSIAHVAGSCLAPVHVVIAQSTARCLVHLDACSITLLLGFANAHHTFCTGSVPSDLLYWIRPFRRGLISILFGLLLLLFFFF